MSKLKVDYETIPDVAEDEDTVVAIPKPKVDPRKTYPEANEVQARLLGDLDELIKLPNPKVNLPRITAQQVDGVPTSWNELVEAIKLPTQTFVGTAIAALVVIVWGSPLAQALYPYVAAIAAFWSSVPSLENRLTGQFDKVSDKLDKTNGTIEAQVDAVAYQVNTCVDCIQGHVKKALEPDRPKLAKAKKAETLLRQYDDSIDIPDIDDLERELDGCGCAIEGKMNQVKQAIDFYKYIPVALRSKENFTTYAIYPILAVFLGLQLYGVYQSSTTDGEIGDSAISSQRFLRGSMQENLEGVVDQATNDSMQDSSSAVSWYPLWVSIQVYVAAVAEIAIGFFMFQAASIAALLNITIGRVEQGANEAIDTTGAKQVFDEYLTTKITILRSKLLDLIHNMIKIDKVQKQMMGGADSLEELARTKIGNGIEQSGISLPWSPLG